MKRVPFSLALITLSMFTAVLLAQSPGVDSDCNELSGKAKGLCNAYCEAMDCDGAEPNASEVACQSQYDAIVEVTGEEPPCVGETPAVVCPCSSNWWRMDLYPDLTYGGVSCILDHPVAPDVNVSQLSVDNSGNYRYVYLADYANDCPLELNCESLWLCGEEGPYPIAGGVLLANAYPQRPESYTQLRDACMREIQLLAEHFGIECVSH